MATTADRTTSLAAEIEAHLSELRAESARYEAALEALRNGNGHTSTPAETPKRRGRPPKAAAVATTNDTERAPKRKHGRQPGRANQALDLVRDRPGITIPELSEAMSIEPNYLYRVMPKLAAEGKARRDGNGWYLAENPALITV